MPTDLSVVIPFDSDCPHRTRALEHVSDWWDDNFPEVEQWIGGSTSSEGWVKARHVEFLMGYVRTRYVVIADADVTLEQPVWIGAAVDNLDGWAVPHKWVVRWDEPSTQRIYDGLAPKVQAQPPYIGYLGGGMTIMPVDTYRSVPLDPRFVGWGQEDESWALALRCLVGEPWRGRGKLAHLWHPPQQRNSRRWGSEASKALAMQYRDAAGDPDAMRALLAEVT